MKENRPKCKSLRRFAIVAVSCCIAYAVAVAINPALAVVPAKIAAGGGVVTSRVAVVAGTLDGEEIVSRKAFDNPTLEIETTNGVLQYRFCNRSAGGAEDMNLVLNIPHDALHRP